MCGHAAIIAGIIEYMTLSAHAYVIQGDVRGIDAVRGFLEKEGIVVRGNPDVLVRTYTAFSMDDARSLRERATLRGVRGPRVFVIAAPTIAPDAQNVLLKTFEEPQAGAKFFLIVPSPDILLPTLRSRMQVLDVLSAHAAVPVVDTKTFLGAPPEKRIEMLKPFVEKDDDDQRDLGGALAFLSDLEKELGKKPRENGTGLQAVYRARKYITDRGALTKALLEQCALLIAKVI